MAGIDIVLNGLMPGEDRGQGLFYHYGLAQLAGSLANQAPHQRGRALCEIFGAYGWAEGVTLMKWMADHMLTGGINYFVPHAFTDREFPDEDCPPHIWAQGKNPQYPFMPVLFGYMNRMAHLLSGGEPLVRNAILFEAESDWAGETCPYFVLGRELLERHVPYHVVCADDLKEAQEEEGLLRIGNMRYANLFIPPAAYLARETAVVLQRLEKKGINIFFVGGKPRGYSGEELPELEFIPKIGLEEMRKLAAEAAVLKVTADRDADETGRLVEDVSAPKAVAEDMQWTGGILGLRCYSYRQQGMRIHMLQNTSWSETVLARILFQDSNPDTEIIRYDGMEQKIYRTISGQTTDGKQSVQICLEPMEAHVYLECARGTENGNGLLEEEPCPGIANLYNGSYRIERAEYDRPDVWLECGTTDTLYDIARKYPGFAGTVRYSLEYTDEGYGWVLLEDALEAVEVFCDGMRLGKRIAPPYRYELPASESHTVHRLRIEVSTTLVNAVPDALSCKRPVAPAGFCGEVLFLK